MTSEFLQKIPAALQEALTSWSKQDGSDLPGYLESLVTKQEAETILNVLDRITAAESKLKASGLPPRVWAGEMLEKLAPEMLDNGPLGDLCGMEPTELGSHIIDLGLAGIASFGEPVVDQVISGVAETVSETGLDITTRFFQSPLGDKEERTVAAVATASTLNLANSLDEKADVVSLTGTIDLGLRAAKIAFKEAAGELDADAAVQALEDRIAAGAVAIADRLVDRLPDAGALVGGVLGGFLGKPTLGAISGRALGEMAEPVVRPLVKKGVDKLARTAVSMVKTTVVSAFKKLKSFVFG